MRLEILSNCFLLSCIATLAEAKHMQRFSLIPRAIDLPFVNKRFQNDPFINVATDAALAIRGGEVLEPKTIDEIESIILSAAASKNLVVIDFSATWCGPCKMIAPLYKELSEMEEHQSTVFLKVDVDENSDAAMKWNVSAMPTFLFIKEGEVVERLMGANPAKLQEMLEDLK